MFSKIQMT